MEAPGTTLTPTMIVKPKGISFPWGNCRDNLYQKLRDAIKALSTKFPFDLPAWLL